MAMKMPKLFSSVSTLEPQWRFKQKTELPWGTVAKQPKRTKYEGGNNRVQLKISNTMSFRTAIDTAPKIARQRIAAFAGKDILAP
ncbi:MAG: hypothetical protein QM684_08610 [Rhizobium sp.]|uniref:hypothetical protein n=1 Tax=Rhizobium sp. SYY.PMSO TaxID=3382192 RepID=UPI000DD81127